MENHTDIFTRIYSMAGELQRLSPWNWMYETDIFGVKIPGTDRIYFVSVMGSEGEFFAVSAYRGRQGLAQFLEFQEYADTMPPETILTIPHLMLSFTDREELDRQQLASIHSSGLKFRGAGNWPRLEINEPAFIPVLPEGDSLTDSVVVLEQTLKVTRRAVTGKDFLYREHDDFDALLVREQVRKNGGKIWRDIYEAIDAEPVYKSFRIGVSMDNLEHVSGLPERRIVIETDMVMLPNPVKPRGEKGYLPYVLMMVDKNSGMVLGFHILTPLPDLDSLYESLPGKVLDELAGLGYRPTRIEVRSSLMYGLLEEPLKSAGCRILQVRQLSVLEDAVQSLIAHLS
jgi:hypothetical protein